MRANVKIPGAILKRIPTIKSSIKALLMIKKCEKEML
jgi:hypothetical protein